jgi:hypothetical protein
VVVGVEIFDVDTFVVVMIEVEDAAVMDLLIVEDVAVVDLMLVLRTEVVDPGIRAVQIAVADDVVDIVSTELDAVYLVMITQKIASVLY